MFSWPLQKVTHFKRLACRTAMRHDSLAPVLQTRMNYECIGIFKMSRS